MSALFTLPLLPLDMIIVSCTTHIHLRVLMIYKLHFSPQYDLNREPRNYCQSFQPCPRTDKVCQILDQNHLLHFNLLQLQLIEIVRTILNKPGGNPQPDEFRPALEFATEQLSPRAPTEPKYQQALERTMALMIIPAEKMTPEFKELLDLKLREKVAISVNKAILESRGQRSEAKIRQLVRARAWAEAQAREAKVDLPPNILIGLDAPKEVAGDTMMQ